MGNHQCHQQAPLADPGVDMAKWEWPVLTKNECQSCQCHSCHLGAADAMMACLLDVAHKVTQWQGCVHC